MDAPVPVALIRDQLEHEAHTREGWICKWVAIVFCAVAAGLAGPVLLAAPRMLPWILAVAGVQAAYHAAMAAWLRRNPYHRALGWANALVELTAPAFLFIGDARTSGAQAALSSPAILAWSGLLAISLIRFDRALLLFAGVFAAAETFALYWFFARPELGEAVPVTLTLPGIVGRCVVLVCLGGLMAAMAHLLARRTEDVVRALRSRDLIGKYVLRERLGVGGMAEVFLATYCPEGGFEKQVAVKRILPAHAADPSFVELFRREAELGSWLVHPNIVQVLDFGRHEDSYFMALEFVPGLTLYELLRRLPEPMPLQVVAYVTAELASALDYLHARADVDGKRMNLVHRDLNPPNVLISRAGEVKLGDFGVARAAWSGATTKAGLLKGKLAYLAPEQLRGEPYDGRADLYALGVSLFEVVSGGENPLRGLDEVAMLHYKLRREFPSLPSVRPGCPPELQAIVSGLLARDPALRIPTGRALRSRVLALPPELAPYPSGQELLAALMTRAMGETAPPAPSEAPTATAKSAVITKVGAP